MNLRISAFALVVALAYGSSAQAGDGFAFGFSPRTGDVWIDSQLGDMNTYARGDRNGFIDDVVVSFGAPRYLVSDLVTRRRWAPGDVYYACALAYQLHRPCQDVVNTYEKDHGQGWGVIAQRMGIKPGSREFFALKGQVGKSNGRFHDKSHVPAGKDEHGPGKSGEHGQGKSGEHGPPADKGKGKGKDKDDRQ